jgi:16S rRNA (adenine1518-N6/adenine1519-N6)-dimethyltransferase
VLAGAYFDLEYLFDVSPQAFTPPPKVVSAVIRMTPKKEPVTMKDERRFKMLVKAAFNQRRKTLRNALRSYFDPEVLESEIFNKRAEQLSVEDFGNLSFQMR